MLTDGEDELICDFAQYYHIYNYKQLNISYVATLANGLPSDSRSVAKRIGINGYKDSWQERILALIYDTLNWIKWSKTKDAEDGINYPNSLYKQLYDLKEPEDEFARFSTGADFEKAWKERVMKYADDS